MTATRKVDFINGAYSQLRINGLTTPPTAFNLSTGLARLEMFARLIASRNIQTGYNFTENPDLNDYTNVDPAFDLMYHTNLAVYLAPDFGKDLPASLVALASATLASASSLSAQATLQPVQYPYRMSVGSGNTLRYRPFNNFYRPSPLPPNASSTHDMFVGDINSFQEDYTEYLRDGETISSYAITADPALVILSDSLTSPVIDFEVQAISQQTTGNWQQIKIIATTSLGRITTRLVNFNVVMANTVGGN